MQYLFRSTNDNNDDNNQGDDDGEDDKDDTLIKIMNYRKG